MKCPKCKKDTARFIQGVTKLDRIEQYHCDECHYTFITNAYGKFIREGYIKEDPIDNWPPTLDEELEYAYGETLDLLTKEDGDYY